MNYVDKRLSYRLKSNKLHSCFYVLENFSEEIPIRIYVETDEIFFLGTLTLSLDLSHKRELLFYLFMNHEAEAASV